MPMNKRYQGLKALSTQVFIAFDSLKQHNVILKNQALSGSLETDLRQLTQLHVASRLRHPNLVPLLDYFSDGQNIVTVSPIVNEPVLFLDVVQSADRDARLQMLIVLIESLQFLHENHLIHGQVVPENILISEGGNLRIKDFGQRIDATVQDDLYAVGILLYMLMAQDTSLDFYTLLNNETTPDLYAINTDDDAYDDKLRMILYWLFECKHGKGYSNAVVVRDALNSLRKNTSPPMTVIKQDYLPYPPLIGRDRVIKRFDKALTQAQNHQGAMWFLHGEPGIGKTRILMHFKHQAQLAGFTVLSAQTDPWRSTWMQIVKQLLVAQDMYLEQDDARILRHVDPEIADILNLPEDAPLEDTHISSERISEIITTLFEGITAPTVVLLDDFEYLNDYPLTLSYLQSLVDRLPLVIVCTTAMSDRIKAVKNRYTLATFINLKPLNAEDITTLCQYYSPTPVHHLIQKFVFNQSLGVPFYALETICTLIDHAGHMEDVNYLELPKQNPPQDAVAIARGYLEQIAMEDRQAVIFSALLGNTINLPLLQAILSNQNINSNWLYNKLFIVEFENWSFKNMIIREGILKQLSDEERQRYSRFIAEALETLYDDRSTIATSLVAYWHMAGDVDRELDNIRLSIDRIMDERHDYLQARDMVERALTLLPEDDKTKEATRLEFLQLLGDICLKQQEIGESLLYYLQALSLSRLNNTEAEEIHILRRVARALSMQGEDREALAALERSFKICQRLNDMRSSAFVLYELAVQQMRMNRYEQAYRNIQRCFRVFDVLPEDDAQLQALLTRVYSVKGAILNQQGDVVQSIELFQSAIEQLKKTDNRRELVIVLEGYAQALISQVSFGFADEVYQQILQHYNILRDYSAYQRNLIEYARLKMMQGQLEEADRLINDALEPGHYVDAPELMVQALLTAGMIAFSAKNYETAIDNYKRAYELAESHELAGPVLESNARRAIAMFYADESQQSQARTIIVNINKLVAKQVDDPALQLTVLVQLLYILIETDRYISAAKTIKHIRDHLAHTSLHEFEIRHYLIPALEKYVRDEELQIYLNSTESIDTLSQLMLDVVEGVG